MTSMSLPAERGRHAKNVWHIAFRQRETHLVCLSCSAESATKALSLALHSVPRAFHLALRGYTSVNAENLGDFREFFGRKVLN